MEWWTFNGQRDKWMTLGVMFLMMILSMLDLMFDWLNFAELSSASYDFKLVVGPPPPDALTALLVFNLLGTLLFIVEFINILTILTNERRTRIPIEYEQGLIMLLEEIPLAATNLTIVTCRVHHYTTSQVLAGVFGIVNVAVRLYVYGCYREYEYTPLVKSTYKTTLRMAVYITVTMLWISLLITQGFMLHPQQTESQRAIKQILQDPLDPRWLSGVSLLLVFMPSINRTTKFAHYDLTEALDRQSVPLSNPWTIRDLSEVVYHTKDGVNSTYLCNTSSGVIPDECKDGKELRFRFFYTPAIQEKPYGNIRYNVAKMTAEGTCTAALKSPWQDLDWRLLYVKVEHNHEGRVIVNNAWPGACTMPKPFFDPHIHIC